MFNVVFHLRGYAQYIAAESRHGQSSKPGSDGIARKMWKVASRSHPRYQNSKRFSRQEDGFLLALSGLDPMSQMSDPN